MADKGEGNAGRTVWLEMDEVDDGHLQVSRFAARADETWCVYGDNRSGIDRFVELFRHPDNPSLTFHKLEFPKDFGIVSFKDQQDVFEREVRNDESDFLDRIDPGTPARNFLANLQENFGLVEQFKLVRVLNSGYRQLSSGESRKLLILKVITEGAAYLIIENPYDGLDTDSRAEFDRIMELLLARGIAVLLILSSRGDIPDWCTHLAWLEKGRLVGTGTRAELMRDMGNCSDSDDWGQILEFQGNNKVSDPKEELVRLVNGRARYGERTIFSNFNFRVFRGQHTLVSGPNGAGKSTLLGVITGDHQD
ncbi:MAG: ATP-binding cassette domain-containing protein, partial [Desulfofustis sp.]|nr:ATP-binding cassette domain-containing protein [Desulfofustis sp.]